MGADRHKLHEYADREALAEALAAGVGAVLAGGLATRGSAILAVSGGSTPRLFFETLARAEIDWQAVTVLLVDERWVPAGHERANATLVHRHLLQGPAAAARFEPYYTEGLGAPEGAARLSQLFGHLARPIDALVLGMGADGHTASFFPGADRLAEALDPATPRLFEAVEAPGAGEPRVTLTLPPIVEARFLALHIEGEEKRRVLAQAQAPGPWEALPVRAVLRSPRAHPIEIFWAP
nr:6-phosphogluconolactonase [Aureimonas populi]